MGDSQGPRLTLNAGSDNTDLISAFMDFITGLTAMTFHFEEESKIIEKGDSSLYLRHFEHCFCPFSSRWRVSYKNEGDDRWKQRNFSAFVSIVGLFSDF